MLHENRGTCDFRRPRKCLSSASDTSDLPRNSERRDSQTALTSSLLRLGPIVREERRNQRVRYWLAKEPVEDLLRRPVICPAGGGRMQLVAITNVDP